LSTYTLHHGDALEIMRAMPDASVDMVFADPPYGHKNNDDGDLIRRWEVALGKGPLREGRPIASDGVEANDLVRAFFGELPRLLRKGGVVCCCCGGGGPDPQFARWSLWLAEVLNFKQMIIWDKGKIGMGWHYRRSYETVLVAHKGAKCNWFSTAKNIENILRPGDYGAKKIIPRAHQHPTEKPWQLAAHFIGLHCPPGGNVLDPFMGSGSTGEAALRLGREFIGVEMDAGVYAGAERRLATIPTDMFEGKS